MVFYEFCLIAGAAVRWHGCSITLISIFRMKRYLFLAATSAGTAFLFLGVQGHGTTKHRSIESHDEQVAS